MELWIDHEPFEGDATRLRLAGRLQCQAVELLRREIESLDRSTAQRLELDLSRLTYLSLAGAELLRALAAKGVRLRGAPPLIAEMLSELGLDPDIS